MKQLSNYGVVLLFGALLLSPLSIWAQEQVSGTVTDENGAPLPGTTVVVEETNQGTTTDFDGNYQINAAQGQTLVFSYVGYESQSVAVGTSSSINMQLQAANELEEVIITALGLERETADGIDNPEVEVFEEIFLSNVPSSEFSKAENGKFNADISLNIGDVMEGIGITTEYIYGGDIFLMRLALKVTTGDVIYTSNNVGSKIKGSSAFLSPFRYSTSVVCAPPAGTWTIEMEDSYGDGWNGAKIVVNLNGEETDYTITEGSSGSGTVEVPEGSSALVFTFVSVDWDSEVTFNITSPSGIVTSGGPTPTAGPIKLSVDFCL